MNLELNVVKFDNEDVIATSGEPTLYKVEFKLHNNGGTQDVDHWHAMVEGEYLTDNTITFINKDNVVLYMGESLTDKCWQGSSPLKDLAPIKSGNPKNLFNASSSSGYYTLEGKVYKFYDKD